MQRKVSNKNIFIIRYYMAFFNPDASLVIRRGKLPHWRQEGVIYFVTFRLRTLCLRPNWIGFGVKRSFG